jgi:biopolymer transport protein ExbD
MMRAPRSNRPRSISFKITAMIDMAFLLITFFVMSIRFGQAGEEQIKLPDADQAKEVTDQRIELVTVNVTRDGLYLVNGVRKSGGELSNYLQSRKEESTKSIELVIRGDRNTQFSAIQRAMRLSAEAGIHDVNLAALQTSDEEEQP